MLFNARAQLLGAITFSLLSQSCILLYQEDGGAGGLGGSGGLGAGGLGGGVINAGGAGGAGGASLCGTSEGTFPLVDVGLFAPGGDPLWAKLQSLAHGAGDSVVAAGFSGNGFTPCSGTEVPEDTFFLLRLNESGGLGEPVKLEFAGAGNASVISLARDNDGLLVAMSRPNGLKVQRLTPELTPDPDAVLLRCQPDEPGGGITQGRVVSNGSQIAVAAELAADRTFTCTGAALNNQMCSIPPMMNAQAGSMRTLLWSPPGGLMSLCDSLQFVEPTTGELHFANPRIALGLQASNGISDVLLTALGGPPSAPAVHQVARLTLEEGKFSVPMRADVGDELGLLLPTLLRAAAEGEKGVLGGVVGTNLATMPPTPAVSVRFANNLDPIAVGTEEALVAAPSSKTESHIVAMDADAMQFLVVAQVDQAGAKAFGSPGAVCAGPGLCGLWRTLDGSLIGGSSTITTAGVYPSTGILIGPSDARHVVWAGQFDQGFSIEAASLPTPPPGERHAFVARQKL